MKTRNHLEPVPSWKVTDTDNRKPNKGITTGKLVAGLGVTVMALIGYSQYNDMKTIDDNAQIIEVTTYKNPTLSGMEAAHEQLPKHVVDLIDRSEMGAVISNEIYDKTGEKPNEQGAHTLEVTVEFDGDVEKAELEK